MHLYVIAGPVGAGKTARSTDLARRIGAPVVVADRWQTFPALEVVSGRPSLAAVAGTRRYYPGVRALGDGPPAARVIARAVSGLITELGNQPLVILEVRDPAVYRELIRPRSPLPVSLRTDATWETLDPAPGVHERLIWRRATDMVTAGLLGEVRAAWQDEGQRPWLADLPAVAAVVAWARWARLDLAGPMERPLSAHRRHALVTLVAAALAHTARVQARQIVTPSPPPPRTAVLSLSRRRLVADPVSAS